MSINLEIHTIINGDPEVMQSFHALQTEQLASLQTNSQSLESDIYLLKARKNVYNYIRQKKIFIATRKSRAIELCEFRDPALEETVNFALEFDDDDVFDENFFSQQMKHTNFNIDDLLKNAMDKKKNFMAQKQAQKSDTELNAELNVVKTVSDTFLEGIQQKLNNQDVFNACVSQFVEIANENKLFCPLKALQEEDAEMNKQMTKLHQEINQLRLDLVMAKNDVEISVHNADRSDTVMQQINNQIDIITRKNDKMKLEKQQYFNETVKDKVVYNRPWRCDSRRNSAELKMQHEYKRLQFVLGDFKYNVGEIKLSIQQVLSDSVFKLHFNFKGDRMIRYLIDKTQFLEYIQKIIRLDEVVDKIFDKYADNEQSLNVFITEK
ncbi:hypothetical protein SS50377_24609 [Spironucleus salmonicida]|uniref:Uncharacterized protein n=1 Tax=Spironucleus salmonicida TaxID=348837 RepID=V6LJH9_9EUKA|nr:hypothetical protein SS50377_24609 [Spironucleus salmonicida]|eukprot:EST44538.1 Hypothetical protein SS50377_15538 [Spironucleus salmonicida]